MKFSSLDSSSLSSSFDLNETGEVCPITGRKFMTHPDWRVDGLRYGTRMEVLSEQIVVDRAYGSYRGEEVQSCLAAFDKVMERLPGPVVLIEEFSKLVSVDHRARQLYEQGMLGRSDTLRGLVFVGLRPMFRLFLRLARRLHPIPFPIHLAKDWKEALEAASAMLEGKGQMVLDAMPGGPRAPRRIPVPGFLLRGYAEELRVLVSDMPWDSAKEAVNPLPATHPFHEVVDAWVAVKRDLDWLDKLRQDRERDLRSTARTLSESEGRYRAVFEASGTALILYGADRRIQMVNRATERMAKLSREELEGRFEWTHFTHPDDVPNLVARHNARQFDPNFDQGRLESRFVDAEGELHWADVTVESVPGTDLRVASLEDRTAFRAARLALEESERRFRQIVEVSQEGIWTADLAGRTTWSNSCMAELLGCDSSALSALSFLELLPADPQERLEVLQKLLEGQSVVFEGRLPVRDGRVAWAIVSASPIRGSEGVPTGFFAMCTDITRRREAETALRELNRDLEDRVRDRTAELEKTNDELAQALRVREDFLASISHELRTPLAAVLGVVETLRDDTEPARKEYLLDLADRNGRQLLSLIEDVLDFARGRAGRLSVELGSIGPVDAMQGAVQSLELQASRTGTRLVVVEPSGPLPLVIADPVRLRQILTNFANNALRHAGDGKDVEVCARQDGSGVRFEVRDRGDGVPVQDRSRLFQPFVQLHPSARRGGAGLGLALSRQLAQAMGGDVGYDVRPGGGSIFWLNLPAGAFASLPEMPAMVGFADTLPAGRVLLVEDEKDLRDILSEHLVAKGWEVVTAHDAESAIARFHDSGIQMAVVDIGLPGMDGLELIGTLRNLSDGRGLGVVALTGQAFPEDAERCMQAGADRFLTKPTSLRKTEAVLRELLAQVRDKFRSLPE